MDVSLPTETLNVIEEVMSSYRREGIDFDALRTRQAGAYSFASLHVLVPGDWTVQKGHDYAERIEADLRAAVPHLRVITHLEPKNYPASDGRTLG